MTSKHITYDERFFSPLLLPFFITTEYQIASSDDLFNTQILFVSVGRCQCIKGYWLIILSLSLPHFQTSKNNNINFTNNVTALSFN